MNVADVMTRHVEFIEPDATAQDAAVLMGELDVSALPIGEPQNLLGVITDRDLLYRVVAGGKNPATVRILEVASTLVFTCRPDDTVSSAMDLMASHNIRRLPVTENDKVIGWLTLSDLSRRLLIDSKVIQDGLVELAASLGTPAESRGIASAPPEV